MLKERLIQKIDKDTSVVFDKGNFDNWCVYIKTPDGKRAPRDKEYFQFFVKLGAEFSNIRVYKDFVSIYKRVSEKVEKDVLQHIIRLAKTYPSPINRDVALYFVVIYASMIAERNKKNAILKERIKRLAMHQILVEEMSVPEAANFSKGKAAELLKEICNSKGF